MIYSKWLPDRGGYAYYETSERKGLGDDLSVPRLRNTTELGVASTDIGRALPLGAKIIGYGPLARGSVTPLDRSGLSGVAGQSYLDSVLLAGAAVVSAFVGVKLVRSLRK